MSYSYDENDPDITYEALETGKGHDSTIVSNVYYGNKRKSIRESKSRDRLHEWINKSLNPHNSDSGIIASENIGYGYTQYTVNDKGKRVNDYYTSTGIKDKESSNISEVKISAPIDPQVERFLKAKREAGLI